MESNNYVQLTYDGNGKRVKKYNYNTGLSVLYFGELYEVRGSVGIIQVFAGKQRVASVFLDGRTQFYHANHLGSSSVITDGNGAKKEKMEYFPFGTYRESVDYDAGFPDVFYTFTGQEDDDDLGFYNFKARIYDPVLGRFISPDTLIPSPEDPQAMNRYSYAMNNPLIYVDPTGHIFTLYHIPITFTAELLRGNSFWGALKVAYNDCRVDIVDIFRPQEAQLASNANQHYMIGWLTDAGRYQRPEEARLSIYTHAITSLSSGEYSPIRHLLNDWGHGLESMEVYTASFQNRVWHFITKDINPIEVYQAFMRNLEFNMDPYGTVEKYFGSQLQYSPLQPNNSFGTTLSYNLPEASSRGLNIPLDFSTSTNFVYSFQSFNSNLNFNLGANTGFYLDVDTNLHLGW
jgi:RHS repeat-associated protein